MTITLTSFNRSDLRGLLYSLTTRRGLLSDELKAVNADIKSIEVLLENKPRPNLTTIVVSETRPADRSYLVQYDFSIQDYTCSCESFEFMSGTDEAGHCKHIRKAIWEGRFDVIE